MFTGLVEEMGRLTSVDDRPGGGRSLCIAAAGVLEDLEIGASVAINGCCLTVTGLERGGFAVEVVPETLRRTTVGQLAPGDGVNLERALRLDQRLGGHLMQGHVDGVGEVRSMTPEGEGCRLTLELPAGLRRFVAEKGSIAVDGVSLTVARVTANGCEIALIPHTLEVTLAGRYTAGTRVNLEVDLMARYVARLLEAAGVSGRNP